MIAALALATCLAAFSISGLTSIFAGAFLPVIGLGIAFEIGKLSAVAWLGHRNGARALRLALVALVAILMVLNSIGVHGFLSRAHIEHALSKAADVDARLDMQVGIVTDLDRRIGQINQAAEKSIARGNARRRNFLSNKLVLIANAHSATTLAIGPNFALAQALGNGRLAIGDPTSVAAGRYGKAALEALGVWASVEAKLAPARDVHAALELVSLRDAPLGIVYQTDAVADQGVDVVGTFPASSHPPIVYPLAVTVASTNPAAESYIAFLRSQAVGRTFGLQGFATLQ